MGIIYKIFCVFSIDFEVFFIVWGGDVCGINDEGDLIFRILENRRLLSII